MSRGRAIRWEERLLGFDLRVFSNEWPAERRAAYLLREVAQPGSADSAVWPSIFDGTVQARPAWVGPFQDLWEDLAALGQAVAALGETPRGELVAVTVHARERAGLGSFLEAHRGYDPWTGERVPLPYPLPERCSERWALIGYDVCDVWGLSGLSNCAYDSGHAAELRAAWAPRLNDRHLFVTLDDADAYRHVTDARVAEHAPFWVFGLWAVTGDALGGEGT
ncbi:MAG: hypothetical protein IPG96_15695 [Proteobacteria bacterium]|nr:hypothetical protein [Pseudomonadota bacterium]